MTRGLKAELTLWFVFLSMSLYALGSIVGLMLLSSLLNSTVEEQIVALLSEVAPAVTFEKDKPTLKPWAERLNDMDEKLRWTLQLYDAKGNLLERYGPPGVRHLISEDEDLHDARLAAKYRAVLVDGKVVGYVQIETSFSERGQALQQVAFVLLVLAPFMGIGLGASGYMVASKAVQPMERTMHVLRRFVADAGHELNTPIAVIEASVETIEAIMIDHGIATDVLDGIGRASQRMKELAANLVLLARMESPNQVAPRLPISVAEVVEPIVKEFVDVAKRKNIEIVCQTVPALIIVGHLDSLRRLVSNLIQNAVRYTEPGGRITVSVVPNDTTVAITVEDTGIGIPPDSLDHIFERFYRVDKSRSREGGGSGLGLSIVKAIVEAHKGEILVRSVVGQGSKFTVILPSRS